MEVCVLGMVGVNLRGSVLIHPRKEREGEEKGREEKITEQNRTLELREATPPAASTSMYHEAPRARGPPHGLPAVSPTAWPSVPMAPRARGPGPLTASPGHLSALVFPVSLSLELPPTPDRGSRALEME